MCQWVRYVVKSFEQGVMCVCDRCPRVSMVYVAEVPLTRWMAEGKETEDREGAVKAAQTSHHEVRDETRHLLYHRSICRLCLFIQFSWNKVLVIVQSVVSMKLNGSVWFF